MKKAFIIVLMVCLTFGMAFAAKKADIKVGAQAGYGSTTYKGEILTIPYKGTQGGLYVAATAEYGLKDNIGVKAGFGINTYSDVKLSAKIGDSWQTKTASDSDKLPLQMVLSVAPVYNYELNKELTISGAVGLEMMMGKESKSSDAKTRVEAGFGVEGTVSYALDKQLSVGGGFKWAMLFGSRNDNSYNYSSVKAFAGATYAL